MLKIKFYKIMIIIIIILNINSCKRKAKVSVSPLKSNIYVTSAQVLSLGLKNTNDDMPEYFSIKADTFMQFSLTNSGKQVMSQFWEIKSKNLDSLKFELFINSKNCVYGPKFNFSELGYACFSILNCDKNMLYDGYIRKINNNSYIVHITYNFPLIEEEKY